MPNRVYLLGVLGTLTRQSSLFYVNFGKQASLVLASLTVGELPLTPYDAGVYSRNRAYHPRSVPNRDLRGFLTRGYVHITNSKQRKHRHASPSTTARYDRRDEESLREAARLIAVPFKA